MDLPSLFKRIKRLVYLIDSKKDSSVILTIHTVIIRDMDRCPLCRLSHLQPFILTMLRTSKDLVASDELAKASIILTDVLAKIKKHLVAYEVIKRRIVMESFNIGSLSNLPQLFKMQLAGII